MASKFTPEIRATIIEALRENPSVPSAASKAGINPVTLNRWLQQGEEGNPEFAEFALEAAQARRTMKDEVVAALYRTATDELHPQQTKAAHLLLTNLYPTEFANVKHTVTHKSKDPEIDLSSLSTEELRTFHRTLKKVTGVEPEQKPVPVLDVVSEGERYGCTSNAPTSHKQNGDPRSDLKAAAVGHGLLGFTGAPARVGVVTPRPRSDPLYLPARCPLLRNSQKLFHPPPQKT